MKFLIYSLFLTAFLINTKIVKAKVLYCSEEGNVGFKIVENYKIMRFNKKNFRVKIDFDNKNILSERLFFQNVLGSRSCVSDEKERSLYCINRYGSTFNINLNTMKFLRSSALVDKGSIDDVVVSYGTCESF
jgi:hypothetical protein